MSAHEVHGRAVIGDSNQGRGRSVRNIQRNSNNQEPIRNVSCGVVYVENDPRVVLRIMVIQSVQLEDGRVHVWVGPIRGILSSARIGEIAVGVMILKFDVRVTDESIRDGVLHVGAKVAGDEHLVSI